MGGSTGSYSNHEAPLLQLCFSSSNDAMNFFQAQDCCYDQGGYMAEIYDKRENDLVKLILAKELNYWIGLADFGGAGRWTWQDSHEPVTWFDWGPGQPDNK